MLGVGRGEDEVAEEDGTAVVVLGVVDTIALPLPVPRTTEAPQPASARDTATVAIAERLRGYTEVMTETAGPEEDDLRRHAEDPAEGAEPDASEEQYDVAREHQEEPSEG